MRLTLIASIVAAFCSVVLPASAETTANLNLQFAQNNEIIAPQRNADGIHELTLSASAFDIRLPDAMWRTRRDGDQGLIVSASARPDFLTHLRTGVAASDVNPIGPRFFRAMAWSPDDTGDLLTAERPIGSYMDFGYNWINEHRFILSDGQQVLTVTALTDRDGLAPLLRPGTVVTMVFYLDRGLGNPANVASRAFPEYRNDDVIDAGEIDIVRITFSE